MCDVVNFPCPHCGLLCGYYICGECYSEFKEYRTTWPGTMTAGEVRQKIEEFFATKPRTHITLDSEGIDAEIRNLTRNNYEDSR
jgi:hypothetical protein